VRIRKIVLPMLESELGPGIAESLARTGEILNDDLAYLDAQALAEFQRIGNVGSTAIVFDAKELERLPKVIRIRVYQQALELLGTSNSRIHLKSVDELIENWHGQKELTLPGVRVIRKADEISFKTTKTLNPGAC
jgi:tRNA(Ile)-lysidine synthase